MSLRSDSTALDRIPGADSTTAAPAQLGPVPSDTHLAEKTEGSLRTDAMSHDIADVEVGGGTAWSALRTKALVRKLDWNLLPFLSFLYLLSFLDRTNIGNGKLADLEKDLHIDPQSILFNVAVSVFFPWYVLAEIPSNLMMKRFSPSVWLPAIMVAWGVCCTCMGFVKNYGGLLAARSAMGLAEGGLYPGVNYYITQWYKRKECGLRMALFFSAATAAGAFGGLLARAIITLDGVRGLSGWSWIFIIEGAFTIAVALVAPFFMHDYPTSAKFINNEERAEILRRLEEDRSVLADEFDMKYARDALVDCKIWVHMFITIGLFVPLYSVATFLPSIVTDLGYEDPESAQLMSAPPYIVAAVACIASGWGADRCGQRGVFMVGFCVVAITGFSILLGAHDIRARYFACFLVTSGVYANVAQGVAWNGNNIGGSTKRAVGMAMQIGFGNLGGTAAAFVYRPGAYQYGHLTNICTIVFSSTLCIAMRFYLRHENRRRDRAFKPPAEYTLEEMQLQRDKGDNAQFFRYIT